MIFVGLFCSLQKFIAMGRGTKVISPAVEIGNLQSHQIDIRFHGGGDECGVVPLVDIFKNFVIRE